MNAKTLHDRTESADSDDMQLSVYFPLICIALALTACGGRSPEDAENARAPTLAPATSIDGSEVSATQSSLVISHRVAADGVSTAIIMMFFRNDAGRPLAGQSAKVSVSGAGNVLSACSVSGEDGISRCLLSSTWAEEKQITVTCKYQWLGKATFYATSGQKLFATARIVESPDRDYDTNGILQLHDSFQGKIWNK